MIYGRDYQTGNPQCFAGHECDSLTECCKCDGEYFCDEHLAQCEGCKRYFCARHVAELTKTDCGVLCEDCCPEYGCLLPTEPESEMERARR